MKKVEIEIPENMEVDVIRPHRVENSTIVVELKPRTPRRLVFEEIVGRTHVIKDEFWMGAHPEVRSLIHASHTCLIQEGCSVWKLVAEESYVPNS